MGEPLKNYVPMVKENEIGKSGDYKRTLVHDIQGRGNS
jgi:hypothetical protein